MAEQLENTVFATSEKIDVFVYDLDEGVDLQASVTRSGGRLIFDVPALEKYLIAALDEDIWISIIEAGEERSREPDWNVLKGSTIGCIDPVDSASDKSPENGDKSDAEDRVDGNLK